MKGFGQFCAILITMIASVITNGIVVSHMWNWFIVPLGVSPIGVWLSTGISMTISLFTVQPHRNAEKEKFSKVILSSFATYVGKFMVLGLGAIVKLFI